MPVVVEAVRTPSQQDRLDLAKIYADAPADLFAPGETAEVWLAAALADGSLIAARFNDRLLGAARLTRQHDAWRLSHLCVRSVTRRRGVGLRLVSEAQRMAREAGQALRLQATTKCAAIQALASQLDLPLELSATV
jgi:ribosomal protein S18 acetylase RimI-like enzyme